MREKWPTAILVAAVFAGLAAYLVIYTVRVDQVAAHYRLGSVKQIIRPPLGIGPGAEGGERQPTEVNGVPVVRRAGCFFKLPWPFDKVRWYDQRVQVVDSPQTQIQLPDQNQLIPKVYATWRIVDPVAFQKSLGGDVETAKQTLRQIISGRTPEVLGRYTLRDIVNTDRQALKFDQIEREIYQAVKDSVESSDKAYGVEVCSLGISWIALPQDATAAVFGRMQAERKTEADKLTKDGETIKRTLIAQARAASDMTQADAESKAKAIRSASEAEAAKSYEVFAKAPEFAIYLRRLEALLTLTTRAAAKNEPFTFVLTSNTPPFDQLQHAPLTEQAGGSVLPPVPAPLGSGELAPAPSASPSLPSGPVGAPAALLAPAASAGPAAFVAPAAEGAR